MGGELSSTPDGWAFGEEGGDAFGFVFGVEQLVEGGDFEGEGVGKRRSAPATDHVQCGLDGEWGEGGDGSGDGVGAGEKVGCGEDFVDEAKMVGLGGGDGVAGEDEAEGGAAADEPRKALGAAKARG